VCKFSCAIREHFARVSHSAPCCNNLLQVAVYFKRSSDEFARASQQYVTGAQRAEAEAAAAALHTAARPTTHVWRQHMSHITHACVIPRRHLSQLHPLLCLRHFIPSRNLFWRAKRAGKQLAHLDHRRFCCRRWQVSATATAHSILFHSKRVSLTFELPSPVSHLNPLLPKRCILRLRNQLQRSAGRSGTELERKMYEPQTYTHIHSKMCKPLTIHGKAPAPARNSQPLAPPAHARRVTPPRKPRTLQPLTPKITTTNPYH